MTMRFFIKLLKDYNIKNISLIFILLANYHFLNLSDVQSLLNQFEWINQSRLRGQTSEIDQLIIGKDNQKSFIIEDGIINQDLNLRFDVRDSGHAVHAQLLELIDTSDQRLIISLKESELFIDAYINHDQSGIISYKIGDGMNKAFWSTIKITSFNSDEYILIQVNDRPFVIKNIRGKNIKWKQVLLGSSQPIKEWWSPIVKRFSVNVKESTEKMEKKYEYLTYNSSIDDEINLGAFKQILNYQNDFIVGFNFHCSLSADYKNVISSSENLRGIKIFCKNNLLRFEYIDAEKNTEKNFIEYPLSSDGSWQTVYFKISDNKLIMLLNNSKEQILSFERKFQGGNPSTDNIIIGSGKQESGDVKVEMKSINIIESRKFDPPTIVFIILAVDILIFLFMLRVASIYFIDMMDRKKSVTVIYCFKFSYILAICVLGSLGLYDELYKHFSPTAGGGINNNSLLKLFIMELKLLRSPSSGWERDFIKNITHDQNILMEPYLYPFIDNGNMQDLIKIDSLKRSDLILFNESNPQILTLIPKNTQYEDVYSFYFQGNRIHIVRYK